MKILLPIIYALLLLSCTDAVEKNDVLFAGEIVNPSSEYVVLYKGAKVIDSAKLDDTNRFAFQLDSIESGLYHFNHEPEVQYVYLEKGDSLLVRLNTQYFDESLVFSGTNEDVNNFLLELFLSDEEEEQHIRSNYYGLEAAEFKDRITALRQEKLAVLATIQKESFLSPKAFDIAKSSVDYTYYRYMEVYPFEHKRKLKEQVLHEPSKEFYNYRRTIDYNDAELTYLRPYYDFMKSHLGNISYMTCNRLCKNDTVLKKDQLHFNRHKLHVIDSLVVEKDLRDNLFRNVAFDYLLKGSDTPEKHTIFINDFQKVSGNNMHIKEIENLYNGIRNMQPNSTIPGVKVLSTLDSIRTLTDIAKGKKTVFYFWSATNKSHYENVFMRVNELAKSKPDYQFVGINIKTDKQNWVSIIDNHQLDGSKQFRSANFEEVTEKLILYPLNKCIITDDALIVNAFSNIYSNF